MGLSPEWKVPLLKTVRSQSLWIIQSNWDTVSGGVSKEKCSLGLQHYQEIKPNVSFCRLGESNLSTARLMFPFVTPLKRDSWQMLAVVFFFVFFNEMRLPESEC